ncbi:MULTISPECIES: hypothetical protein [Trueperella]|uniref:Uncharacterized protein n=1 Tax=Trueperella bernardiae TaxID=59561 RepID=A0A0W1KIP7_9ACTO|nr:MULTISPECIES: hypothetical protein [Trueperella]KTF03896.1 hypothetical protein AQZ59_01225 [Trueperella bernardiae]MCM3907795.1 hypothetical protein [Trueperella bernardiae]MDK8602034.1 hypothetical protein [Trueperella bernardiae]MDV6239618.1 hypothetical protein [Trueperella bernardiae]WIM07190.1 hypothetical protein QPC17_05340 [Trueperella bernardiae]
MNNADNPTIIRSYDDVPVPTRLTLHLRKNPVWQLGHFVSSALGTMGMVVRGHDKKM